MLVSIFIQAFWKLLLANKLRKCSNGLLTVRPRTIALFIYA